MNSRYAMIDAMLTQWLSEIEDTALFRSWEKRINDRIAQVEQQRELTQGQIEISMRMCSRGDPLYAAKRVRLKDCELYPIVYFHSWQPRARRLWVCADQKLTGRPNPLTLERAYFHQLARTEVAVRRRAPVTALPPTKKPKRERKSPELSLFEKPDGLCMKPPGYCCLLSGHEGPCDDIPF